MSKRDRERRRTVRGAAAEDGVRRWAAARGRVEGEELRLSGRGAASYLAGKAITAAFDDAILIVRSEGKGAWTTVLLRTWFDLARFVLLLLGNGGNAYFPIGEVTWDNAGVVGQPLTPEHKAYYERAMRRLGEVLKDIDGKGGAG